MIFQAKAQAEIFLLNWAPVVEWLKLEQKKPRNEGKTREQIWEDYLSDMSEEGEWADEVIILAAAMFFGKDILVIPESTNYTVYGSMEGQGGDSIEKKFA